MRNVFEMIVALGLVVITVGIMAAMEALEWLAPE